MCLFKATTFWLEFFGGLGLTITSVFPLSCYKDNLQYYQYFGETRIFWMILAVVGLSVLFMLVGMLGHYQLRNRTSVKVVRNYVSGNFPLIHWIFSQVVCLSFVLTMAMIILSILMLNHAIWHDELTDTMKSSLASYGINDQATNFWDYMETHLNCKGALECANLLGQNVHQEYRYLALLFALLMLMKTIFCSPFIEYFCSFNQVVESFRLKEMTEESIID